MTDLEIRQLIESGVDRSEIEYIMQHSEIGSNFQDQLIGLLAKGDREQYEAAIEELILQNIWDESKDANIVLSPEEEDKLNEAVEYVMNLDEPPKELPTARKQI